MRLYVACLCTIVEHDINYEKLPIVIRWKIDNIHETIREVATEMVDYALFIPKKFRTKEVIEENIEYIMPYLKKYFRIVCNNHYLGRHVLDTPSKYIIHNYCTKIIDTLQNYLFDVPVYSTIVTDNLLQDDDFDDTVFFAFYKKYKTIPDLVKIVKEI